MYKCWMAQAFVRTSQVCAQYACATELIPDHINTIRTQTRQSKLILTVFRTLRHVILGNQPDG